MKKMFGLMMVLLVAAFCAQAVEMTVHPSTKYGPGVMVSAKYSDFTESTVNTAQTMTWTVAANEGYELVAMELVTAFDTGNTNYTGSVAVTVGDGTDADLFLTSTELASDGTEVWAKFGNANGGTIAVTPQTTTVETDPVLTVATTNITYDSDGSATMLTNTLVTGVTVATTTSTVATNATATYTASVLGRKVYTAADTVDFTFTPNAEEALDENTQGEVRFFFRKI